MIYPLKETRPKLHFVTGVNVKHVIFDEYVLNLSLSTTTELKSQHSEKRATGVAFTPNPLLHREIPVETRTVRGTKLIVISSGSFGTPGILERSGIGAKDVLEGVGVKQRDDLPGVGENFQGLLCKSCRQPNPVLTLDLHRSQYPIHSLLFCRRGTDIRCD
jgi:choline dehydrogenase-like flavoprotein